MEGQERRRILFCENNTDGTIGGSHYCMLYLVEGLDKSRFDPVVVFYEDHVLMQRFRACAETIVIERPAPLRLSWLERGFWARHRYLAMVPRLMRRGINFAKWMLMTARCVAFLRQQRIALVDLNNSITLHHDWMVAALLTGTPCLTHERGVNPRYSWMARFLGRRLQLVIPVARWIQDWMVTRGVDPANLHVLYDGLDPEGLTVTRSPEQVRRDWNIADDQPIVGIVGNIRAWKGQDVVVKAIGEAAKRHANLVCLFVGAVAPVDEPFREKVEDLVRTLGVERNVRFVGYQRHVADFLNAMSIVIHASVEPEPFGMVVLEGMALKKPVLGSAEGGPVEIMIEGQTGYTFTPGDAGLLAERLIELLDAPERAAWMGEQGYARLVRDFTVRRYLEQMHAVYDSILEGRPPTALAIPAGGLPSAASEVSRC